LTYCEIHAKLFKAEYNNYITMDLSILICTHNSGNRIVDTLHHLQRQRGVEDISWEVLIVDYISSDGTTEIAKAVWSVESVPLICISEQRAGKTPALETGLKIARGDAICIIDDDNWADESYVITAHNTMKDHPEIGVIGAYGEAHCEIDPPEWFHKVPGTYAVGSQGSQQGYIDGNRNLSFWGAGSVIRREAWLKAKRNGFVPILNPTRGEGGVVFSKGFTAGEDGELCYAIQLVGFRLWYEPNLKYKHFIPKERLSTDFYNNAVAGCSAVMPLIRLYLAAVTPPSNLSKIRKILYENWVIHMLYIFARFAQSIGKIMIISHLNKAFEFNKTYNKYRSEIRGLWELRLSYKTLKLSISKISQQK
jgi:glycosyltransferase involved in cell wall biosynthesis